jgi:hypothetical protein
MGFKSFMLASTVKPVLNGPFIKRNFVLNGNIFRSRDYHSLPWLNGNLASAEKCSGPLRLHLRQVLLYIVSCRPAARQQLRNKWLYNNRYWVMAATDTHATEKLLEAVFSVRSLPRLSNEGQLLLDESLQTAVRRVGGWCEMAESVGVSGVEWVSCWVSELRGLLRFSPCELLLLEAGSWGMGTVPEPRGRGTSAVGSRY